MNNTLKSPSKQIGFSPLSPIILAIACCFYYLQGVPVLEFPDVGWHIATGDYIRAHGIPETDIWAFTSDNTPWYNISWSFDVGLSFLHQWLGLDGLYVVLCLVLGVVVAMVYQVCALRGVSQESALITTFLSAFCLLQYSALRPQLFTLIFALIIHLILNNAASDKKKYLSIIPLIMLLWANIHGGFLIGFILIAVYIVQAYFYNKKQEIKPLIIVGVLSFLTIFINPYGWEIIPAIYSTLGSDFAKHVSEWWPPRIFETISLSLIVSVFILVSNVRAKYVPIADKILAFFWLSMAFNSSRNFAIFAVLSAPYIALSINSFKHEENAWLKQAVRLKKNLLFTSLVAVLVIALVISFNFLLKKDNYKNNFEEMSGYLSKEYPGIKLFNIYGAGGKLIYYGNNDFKVFIDGRAGTAYPEHLMQDYQIIVNVAEGWEDLLKKYDVEAFMLAENHTLSYALKLNPKWQIVYKTKSNAIIFVRSDKLKESEPPTVPFG